MVKVYIGALLFSGLFFSGCQFDVKSNSDTNGFSLTGYLDNQVMLLLNREAGIKKSLSLVDTEEIIVNYPDSTGWKKELSLFYAIDIFKPGILSFYRTMEIDSLNLHWKLYFIDPEAELETKYLAVGYEDQDTNIRRVYAVQDIENPIYTSGRELNLWISSEIQGNGAIDSFDIRGFQKILTLDSTLYHSHSKIMYDKPLKSDPQ